MQEYGWLHWNDLQDMSAVLGLRASPRKKRLFGCACVRCIQNASWTARFCHLLEATEAYADCHITREQLKQVRRHAQDEQNELRDRLAGESLKRYAPSEFYLDDDEREARARARANDDPTVLLGKYLLSISETRDFTLRELHHLVPCSTTRLEVDWQMEKARRCDLARDIFGNPFRPVAFAPEWRSDTALSLARHIYEARDFAQMPILADALQDAGCDNADILNHCREPNATHVRGCWVVDLVLGKE
jgi:hypothetical protein